MPTFAKGLNLTSEWQAYAIIGTVIVGIIVMIVGFVKGRKW